MKNQEILLSIVIPSKCFDDDFKKCIKSVFLSIEKFFRGDNIKSHIDNFVIEINVILKERYIIEAEFFYKNQKNINFYSQGKELKGESYARNVGIKNSNGLFLGFVDHDCVVDNSWITQIINTFQIIKKYKDIVCILGKHWPYQKYSIWLKLYEKYRKNHATEHFEIYNELTLTNRLDGRNFAIIKDVARKFKFREDMPTEQDREFGVKLVDSGYRILFNDKMIVYHKALSLFEILERQYRYGKGSRKWRSNPNWFYRFYLINTFLFLKGKISITQSIFNGVCNFLYQLGRLNSKI